MSDSRFITLHTAQTALPSPPTTWGLLPKIWKNYNVDEFDLEVWAAASTNLTAAELRGCTRHPVVLVDDDVDAVTEAADTLTVTGHAYETGDGPVRFTTTDTLPAGLELLTDYWLIKVDANTVKVCATWEYAMLGVAIDITDAGTGTHTISDTADTERNHWHVHGLLGPARDGAVALTRAKAYRARCRHAEGVLAYALTATLSAAEAVSARIQPRPLTTK